MTRIVGGAVEDKVGFFAEVLHGWRKVGFSFHPSSAMYYFPGSPIAACPTNPSGTSSIPTNPIGISAS